MVETLAYGSSFNLGSLYLDDVYLEVLPPQAYFGGTPTSIACIVGTASWGELDTPTLISDPTSLQAATGGITAAAVTDIHDLATEATFALNQAKGTAGLAIYVIRRSNGSDLASTGNLMDMASTSVAGAVITAIYTGTLGNQIAIYVTAGLTTNLVNVTVVPFAGGGAVENYTNLPNTAGFWNAFISAVNAGQGPSRPPSQLIKAALPMTPSTHAPVVSNTPVTLSGGNDGRTAITTAELIGADGVAPTGIYAVQDVQFMPSVLWVAGLSDSTAYPNIQAFCDEQNILGLVTFPPGTSTPTAVAAKNTIGILDYQLAYIKDWHYIFDSINGVVRIISPMAIAGGAIACLPPWASPFNKTVTSLVGTERINNPNSGTTKYSNAELAQLQQAGIMVISNPIPLGNAFGFRNGYNSVGQNAVTSFVEYSRMTNYLVNSIGSVLGQFEGQLQGSSVNDPLRSQIRAALNTFFLNLQTQGFIDGYSVICDLTNNTPASIAQHLLYINVNVRYLASVMKILAQLQGGTTVQVTSNSIGNNLS